MKKGKYHVRATECRVAVLNPGKSVTDDSMAKLLKEALPKLSVMFRTVHGLAKNNRPLTDFKWLCDLDEAKGLEIRNTYRSRTQATDFLAYIALKEFMDVSQKIEKRKFITIMGDDSTDVSACEQSMWFARSCEEGQIDVDFISNATLDKADTDGIIAGLQSIVDQNLKMDFKDLMLKVVACTTDGASVMLGRNSGVSI